MTKVATIKVLENGEVKIPREIREDLYLKTGTKLLVFEGKDNLLLKRLEEPSFEESFNKLIKESRKEFRRIRLTKKDLNKAIQKVRSKA
jgi:AbrB family looped-hinge helix DNA binding protein